MSRRLKDIVASWSEQDADSRNAFLLIAGISAVILLAVAIIGYGFYTERVASKNDAVLKVGSRTVSYAELEDRLKFELTGVSNLTSEQFPNVVTAVLVSMENEEIVRLVAAEKGITVTDDEVEAFIRSELNLSADATKEAYAARLRRELLTNGLSLSQYTRMAESLAIEKKLRDFYREPIPSEAEQVDIRILVTQELDEAVTYKQRIDSGETMAGLAAQFSIHPSSESAGEMGFTPRGALPTKVEDAAFAADIGTTTDPIETEGQGVYIVNVRGKEFRAVSDDSKEDVVSFQLAQDVAAEKTEVGSEFLLNAGQLQDLAASISAYLSAGG